MQGYLFGSSLQWELRYKGERRFISTQRGRRGVYEGRYQPQGEPLCQAQRQEQKTSTVVFNNFIMLFSRAYFTTYKL